MYGLMGRQSPQRRMKGAVALGTTTSGEAMAEEDVS